MSTGSQHERNWHVLGVNQVIEIMRADNRTGLSPSEAARRLSVHGPNKLAEAPPSPAWRLFLAQFQDIMVLILLAATGMSVLLGERADAIAILAIVVTNAVMGYVQEAKAEASLAALRDLAAPKARVLRRGELTSVRAEDVVPGDIVDLESGDRVPADTRLLSSSAISVDESALTGESVPVSKDAAWLGRGAEGAGDRKNMLYMGTTIARGRATGVVVATGMSTQIGEIAGLIEEAAASPTPLQVRLEQLGKWLVAACLLVVAVVFAVGVLRGMPVYEMFLTGVSLAVAAIPEGLPAVVTVSLAMGVQRMIRRRAIVRRLPAVETLGCATVICSDKTGTLTKNEMTVVRLATVRRELVIDGAGYDTTGKFYEGGTAVDPVNDPDWRTAIAVAALCNHATLSKRRVRGEEKDRVVGEPTEAALVVLAAKAGIDPQALRTQYPTMAELPFDSDRKRMSVVVRWQGLRSVVKGAPDVVVDRCTHMLQRGRVVALSANDRRVLRAKVAAMGAEALRVLALAYRALPVTQVSDPPAENLAEQGLVFVGLAAMMDPPRDEVRHAIQVAARAGIRTIMVTGDHRETALAIGRQLGLTGAGGAITGEELDTMSDQALARSLSRASVFARVSPRHKLRIVKSLRAQGEIVAMTGDGVNDAPALKEANIGVAMGITGTDVTKEASSMVLADDNYATIVAAVEEGRGIYDNIRKFIRYLLACNVGEVLTMFLAALLGLPLPLLPIQILWMNLVTDGLPAVALGVDPPDQSIMQRPPRPPNEGIFAHNLHLKILLRGILIGVCTLGVFTWTLASSSGDLELAQTMAFSTLVMSQLIYVFQCRSEHRSIFDVGVSGNPLLCLAVAISVLMQLLVIYQPSLRTRFHTVPLDGQDWLVILSFSGWSVVLEGLVRALRLQWRRRIALVRVSSQKTA